MKVCGSSDSLAVSGFLVLMFPRAVLTVICWLQVRS